MIDDILELSRITRSQLVCEEVDLVKESQAIIERLRSQHRDRTVRVTLANELKAYGDPTLLKVTLENLLGNAWKYSAENPDAFIEFGCERDEERRVYFVKDNGVGFDEKYSDKLFKPFERLHNDKRFEGTGIGLATVYRAISRMGGEIWAHSTPGQGSTFFFTLESCR